MVSDHARSYVMKTKEAQIVNGSTSRLLCGMRPRPRPRPSVVKYLVMVTARCCSLPHSATPFGIVPNILVHYRRAHSVAWTQHQHRRNIEIPLLDVTESDYKNSMVQPLPTFHLPPEMATLHVYGMQLERPLHQAIVQNAQDRRKNGGELPSQHDSGSMFGHVAYKPMNDSLIGAIGCTAQVVLNEQGDFGASIAGDAVKTVLCRGGWRFVVNDIRSTVPFPIATVDELHDDDDDDGFTPPSDAPPLQQDEDDEGEDNADDYYSTLTAHELEQRLMLSMKSYIDQQLTATSRDNLTPLEQSILTDVAGMDISVQQQAAEEAAAVFDVFRQYILDECPRPRERYYAVAFLAAEMVNVGNHVRREILRLTNGTQRMQVVLRELNNAVGMARARHMTNAIVRDQENEDDKELQVGVPSLPPWARRIRAGMRLEYFWSVQDGWLMGEVVREPELIVDELILTVRFLDDNSVHRVPFVPDEKARWRPAAP